MINSLIYSSDGLHLTEKFEGCRTVAYQDQVGVWTIGYGHTLGVKQGDTCTLDQAQAYLQSDIAFCAFAVNHYAEVTLTQSQFDALVDFAFNLGLGSLEHSTLWKKLNAGDFAGAAAEFPKWDRAGGKEIPGLLRRRNEEAALFIGNKLSQQ